MEKEKKKRRIVLNGGRERMELKKEVEEAGLVNKHIFWRSAGGNALEGRDMNS